MSDKIAAFINQPRRAPIFILSLRIGAQNELQALFLAIAASAGVSYGIDVYSRRRRRESRPSQLPLSATTLPLPRS
jgi:hypothetical protein